MYDRIIYAANREIGYKCLVSLLNSRVKPVALLLPSTKVATFGREMAGLAAGIPIIRGKDFRQPDNIELLKSLNPDYFISIHFPYIIPKELLDLPKIGTLNLHPAYLPYNKGWHTPSWAIYDDTPYGATLHWVDEELDTGDIALQETIEVQPQDTADSVYHRVLSLEAELFGKAIPLILSNKLPKIKQVGDGTHHLKEDLKAIQKIELNRDEALLLRKLRALTTNNPGEAAYFEQARKKYNIRIEITPEDNK